MGLRKGWAVGFACGTESGSEDGSDVGSMLGWIDGFDFGTPLGSPVGGIIIRLWVGILLDLAARLLGLREGTGIYVENLIGSSVD